MGNFQNFRLRRQLFEFFFCKKGEIIKIFAQIANIYTYILNLKNRGFDLFENTTAVPRSKTAVPRYRGTAIKKSHVSYNYDTWKPRFFSILGNRAPRYRGVTAGFQNFIWKISKIEIFNFLNNFEKILKKFNFFFKFL